MACSDSESSTSEREADETAPPLPPVRVTFISGEELEVSGLPARAKVHELGRRLKELRGLSPLSAFRLLSGVRAMRDSEPVAGLKAVTAVEVVLFEYCTEGYFHHQTFQVHPGLSLEAATDMAMALPQCVAFGRQRDTGETFFARKKKEWCRDNGVLGWEWYDKLL
mmetsp:Transcript_27872/g.59005  ORF Transcript_27872/g.59005 Transcript_27872/m.59005 type:complete len:166 (+) Transcript_27872:71-568(+)